MKQCMDLNNLHRRLRKIEGQVASINRMIEEDVPCEDILSQINAAKSALHKCGQIVLEAMLRGEVLHLPWLGFVRANQVLCAIALVTVICVCLKRLAKKERGKAALICFAQVIPAIGIIVAMEFAALEKKISMIEGWPADVCFLIMGLACLWMGLAIHRVWKKAYALQSARDLIQ